MSTHRKGRDQYTVSLLETTHTLPCLNAVARLAANRLYDLWDSSHVPTKAGLHDVCLYTTMIATIRLAREAYPTDRDAIKLSDRDKERFAYARPVLGELWAKFILAVPDAGAVRRLSEEWYCYGYSDRRPNWRWNIAKRGELRRGAMYPLRYNAVERDLAYFKGE